MAYYFIQGEPISVEVKRIAAEQTHRALLSIENETDIHEVIHDIRKRCKKLRALLRMIRDDTGKEFYNEKNIFYRDLARRISGLRDVHTMIETTFTLKDKHHYKIPDHAVEFVLAYLQEQKRHLVERLLMKEDVVGDILEQMRESSDEIEDWPVSESVSYKVVAPGIKRVYKRGRKTGKDAYNAPSVENFHEFRKRVKYMWYQTRLLKNVWPEMMNPWAEQLHRLANLLGDDHDLAVLKETLDDMDFDQVTGFERFFDAITHESDHLRNSAEKIAGRLFAEKPGPYKKRMGAYWQTWQKEEPVSVIQE